MCFIKDFNSKIAAKRFMKGKILNKDMVVYKGLDKYRGKYRSPYMDFIYETGQHYYQTGKKEQQIRMRLVESWSGNDKVAIDRVVIEDGLHSCLTEEEAKTNGDYVFKMIIPKGAKVWINRDSKEVVSTELIFPHQ